MCAGFALAAIIFPSEILGWRASCKHNTWRIHDKSAAEMHLLSFVVHNISHKKPGKTVTHVILLVKIVFKKDWRADCSLLRVEIFKRKTRLVSICQTRASTDLYQTMSLTLDCSIFSNYKQWPGKAKYTVVDMKSPFDIYHIVNVSNNFQCIVTGAPEKKLSSCRGKSNF